MKPKTMWLSPERVNHKMAAYYLELDLYTPQYGFDVTTTLSSFALGHLREHLTDKVLSKVEDLVALYGVLSNVKDSTGFISALFLYAKTHCDSSFASQIRKLLESSFFDSYEPQGPRPDWLNAMSNIMGDWRLFVSNPAFKKVSKVISLMVTLGVVEKASINLGGFELFAAKAYERQANAVDLIDAVMETITFFAEGAYQCFTHGSLKPLLFSQPEMVELECAYMEKVKEWDFVRNGNLAKFCSKDEAAFDKELTDLIAKLRNLYQTTPVGSEKKIIQMRWEALVKMEADFTASRVRGGLRKAPFCFKVFGGSGVGKSTFADYVMNTVLRVGNVPYGIDHICTLNPDDQYMSTYRSYITGIKLDDLCNTKHEFLQNAPSDWLIKLVNNVKNYANMADLANKGKVTIEPSCVSITTNVEDMKSNVFSNEPVSIIRRCHEHILLTVKKDFCKVDDRGNITSFLDSSKVTQAFPDSSVIPDIWDVHVRYPIFDNVSGKASITFQTDRIMDIHSFIRYVSRKADLHFQEQTNLVERCSDVASRVIFCENCNIPACSCECDEMEPQFGERIAHHLRGTAKSWDFKFRSATNVLSARVEDFAVDELLKKVKWLESSPYARWTNYVPEPWFNNDFVKQSVLLANEDVIGASVSSYLKYFFFKLICWMFLMWQISPMLAFWTGLFGFVYTAFCYSAIVEAKKDAFYQRLRDERDVLPTLFKDVRDRHMNYACGLFAGLACMYGVVQVYKALRANISFQGMLQPKSVADIVQRDSEANPWSNVPKKEKVQDEGATTVMQHFDNIASHAIWNFALDYGATEQVTNAFCVRTNVILIPAHILPTETRTAKISHKGLDISWQLNPDMAHHIPGTDFAMVYVPNMGPRRNFTNKFSYDNETSPIPCKVYYRNKEGVLEVDSAGWSQCRDASNGDKTFCGSYYTFSKTTTYGGLCMATFVSDTMNRHIVGFHLGGIPGTKKGCGGSLNRAQLETAMSALFSLNKTFVPCPQASDIGDEYAGRPIAVSGDVHRKSPVNFIGTDNQILVYGSVKGRSTYKSSVMETPISKIVEEVTGVPNQWGPPRFVDPIVKEDGYVDNRDYIPWQKSLDVCSKPSIGFDPVAVQKAMEDYLSDLKIEFVRFGKYWKDQIRPLSDVETVSGIDGCRFIDAMVSGTSMGYPIHGAKSKYLIDLPPTETHASPRAFTPEIMNIVKEIYDSADKGEVLNQPFYASLKDEPTKLSKDKVRVFQAAPVALQFVIRQYFLPIARFLSMNPLISECAVGINAHGIEWNELSEHMAKFGDDRIIAGDYSKYDLRMPAQLTMSAFVSMIEIARWSGNYSAQDIKRMHVIAYDICFPLTAYNGDLLRFLGTNPSGQNMTVYMNSIVNSLLHRLAFFHCYDDNELTKIGKDLNLDRPARFRDIVSLATYGDDSKGSVRPGYDKFNHVTMAEYLKSNDMVFTMPDKTSDPVPFMNRYEADFLKRKDRFDDDLGVHVGVLDEDSIFKSLHSILKSKELTPKQVASQNVDGALREWFFHGQDKFEQRLNEMQEVAKRSDLICFTLNEGYEERVEKWRETYVPQSGTENSTFLSQFTKTLTDDELDCIHTLCKELPTPRNNRRKEFIDHEIGARAFDKMLEFVEVDLNVVREDAVNEDELQDRVVELLGIPSHREYTIISSSFGIGDLIYLRGNVIVIVETKRVNQKPYKAKRVRSQARKYAMVCHVLRPNATIYGFVYTEYGFQLVAQFGDTPLPSTWQALQEVIDTHCLGRTLNSTKLS